MTISKLQAEPLGGRAITAEDEVDYPQTRPRTPRARPYSWDEMKVITDVLMRHPHVWVLTRRHVRASRLRRFQVRHPRPGRAPIFTSAR